MNERPIGSERPRQEDEALLTGEATYTGDVSPPGTTHAAILRSVHGHARIDGIDTADAEELDGVVAVFTGADLEAFDGPGAVQEPIFAPDGVETDLPALATDQVRWIGEAVAVAVAEDPYTARDALDLIDVDYERLDAVTDAREALDEAAPTIHEHAPDNVAYKWEFGDDEATDEAFEAADHVASVDLVNQRVIGNPLEPRAMVAEYDTVEGLTATTTTQKPSGTKAFLVEALGLLEDDVRVISPAVGGGFGVKGQNYPEEILVSWCAMELERPVKWQATRSEAHVADYQSRDFSLDGELALDVDGTIRGLRVKAHHTIGAYHVFGPTLAGNVEALISGQYEIPAIHGRTIATFTNTAPVAPYRGAGRPEVIYFVERLMRAAARELDVDPVALRRRNQISPDAFPHETATGSVYDSGNYERAMDLALEHVDYAKLRERQASLRERERYLGIGISCFVENTAYGPGKGEKARVRVDESGGVTATLGTHGHGQGHRTTFSQLLVDELGIDFDDVEIEEGDTDDLSGGAGTFGSRSAALGGAALRQAAAELRETARRIVADRFEVDVEDVEFADGELWSEGAPERSISLQQVADPAPGEDELLVATATYDPPNFGWTFGTHVAVVEVDPATGEIEFEDYVAVDDCGRQINPMIVRGQVHGGVAQGIGQALHEQAVYDDTGDLVTGSLENYSLPGARDVPEMTTDHTVTPSPHNPLGVKGVGESGTIASPPAVVNAVVDALKPFGVEDVDMPVTSETVLQAIRNSS